MLQRARQCALLTWVVVLCGLQVETFPLIDTNRKCFTTLPGTADRKTTTVKIGVRDWLSHQISSSLVEIILKEFLGFTVEAYDLKGADGKEWGVDMTDGGLDIDVEVLEALVTGDAKKKYIDEEAVVVNLGSPGYSFRKGLYITPATLQTHPYATWYKFYQNATLVKAANLVVSGSHSVPTACDTAEYPWCGSGALAGFWAPDGCKADPTSCAIAFMGSAGQGDDTARFEQLTANFQLKIIHAYAGSSFVSEIVKLVDSGKQLLFQSSTAHELPARLKAKRIAFPDWMPGCDLGSTKEPSGKIKCDYGDKPIIKMVSSRIRKDVTEAYYALSRYQIFISQLEAMISNTKAASGTMTAYEAACDFAKSNYKPRVNSTDGSTAQSSVVGSWVNYFHTFANVTSGKDQTEIKDCITHPPLKAVTGDWQWDAYSMACFEVIDYGTFAVAPCYAPGKRPGNADRSAVRVKVCFQYWLSQSLSSSVASIVMRDFLGYSVEGVDLSSVSTAKIYESIEGGACDMDVESWQAQKTKKQYIDTVINRGVLLNPSDLGYAGRSAMYMTPGVIQEEGMASYWKFFTNATDLKKTSFIRMPQVGNPAYVPTMEEYDPGGWPRCQESWCVKDGNFKGYWVPPQCETRPEECAISFHPVATYDSAFFETLTKTLGLNIMHAYYGWDVGGAVKEVVKNGKNVLFYWWEPDPLLAQVGGAVRLSYPDWSYGCASQHIVDPNAGQLACDYSYPLMQKLVSIRTKEAAPEALFAITNMKINIDELWKMIGMHKDGASDGVGMYQTFDEVACHWIKENEALVMSWAPACVSTPKNLTNLKIGDAVFNSKDLTCDVVSCLPDEMIVASKAGVDCKKCGPGLVPNDARTGCTGCPAGMTPNRTSGKCAPCPAGNACRYGAEMPSPCEKGRIAANISLLECSPCERGKYNPSIGQSKCEDCPMLMTTMILGARNALDCVCPEKMYKFLNATDAEGLVEDKSVAACNSCPAGLECVEGSDEVNIPCRNDALTVLDLEGYEKKWYPVPPVGYFTQCGGPGPLSCFKCLADVSCPGGDVEVCGVGMEGIACGKCEPKWYRSGSVCEPCSDVEKSNLIFPVLPISVAPICVLVFYRFSRDGIAKWNSPANNLAAALFVILIYVQTLAAISACYIAAPPVMADSQAWTRYTYDLMSLLRPGCTTFTDFKSAFIGKLLLPVYAFVMFSFVFIISVIVGCCSRFFRLDGDILANCFWAAFNTFFIGIAQQTFTLFQCYKHPNGDRSMRSQANVLCDEEEWNSLMVIAIVCVAVFCGGFLALNIWIVLMAPRRFSELTFRKRWKFVFIKFRPSSWYWGLTLLIKGVWLNLPTVVFDYGAAQILWLQSLIVVYLVGVFSYMPWRSFNVGCLDIIMHATLIFLFGFVTHFVDMGNTNNDALGTVFAFSSMAPIVVGTFIAGMMLFRRFTHNTGHADKYWQKAAMEACTVFAQCNNPSDLSKKLPHLPFADVVTLNNAKSILELELLERPSSTGKSKPLTGSGLLRVTSRTRLQSSKSSLEEGQFVPPPPPLSGDKVDQEKEKKDGGDVQWQLHQMRDLVKPSEAWLCAALESAVLQKPYDVDVAKKMGGGQAQGPDMNAQAKVEMGSLEFPQEYTGPLLNRAPAFSPRAIPIGKLTTPRTPRIAKKPPTYKGLV